MCSAAYWIGSQCSEIYAGNKTDEIGSIGTMCSFADMQPMWEKQGVVFHEIYASASTDKNKNYMDARKGNYDGIIQSLDQINTIFLNAVKDARGAKLNAKETLTGKVFMAQNAINVGLIDGMKSFEDVITRAQQLANQQKQTNTINTNQSNKNPMKVKAIFGAMTAFLASAFPSYKAEETVLTEEHLEKVNSELETLAAIKIQLAGEKTAKEKAESDLAAANNKVAELNTKIKELESESAGETNTSKTGTDKIETTAKTWQDEVAGLAHNKAVDGNFLFSNEKK
jgi:ClpP class serine protease